MRKINSLFLPTEKQVVVTSHAIERFNERNKRRIRVFKEGALGGVKVVNRPSTLLRITYDLTNYRQKPTIEDIEECEGYKVLTVRTKSDMLYKVKDEGNGRYFVLTCYHKGVNTEHIRYNDQPRKKRYKKVKHHEKG